MSKAILILNNIDESEIAELRANVQLNLYGEDRGEYTNCSLKPMPKKKILPEITRMEQILESESFIDNLNNKIIARINLNASYFQAIGYNDCVDEILGEEK